MPLRKVFDFSIIFIVYAAFAYILWPFKQSLVFAALFAYALTPLLNKILTIKKIKLSEFQSISFVIFSLIAILFIPLLLIILRAAKTITKIGENNISELPLFHKLQTVTSWALDYVNQLSTQFDIDISSQVDLKSIASQSGQFLLTHLSSFLTNIPSAFFQTAIFIIMLYFFLLKRNSLRESFLKSNLLNEGQLKRVTDLFQNTCYLVLISTLIVAFFQALIVTVASLIVGFDDAFIIFLIAFFMAFVPVVGSAPLTIALVIYCAVNGNYGDAFVMAIAAGLASVIDNIIKTYLFSSQGNSVHPIILILAIMGSISVFGILGLFLGPIITELATKIGPIILQNEKELN